MVSYSFLTRNSPPGICVQHYDAANGRKVLNILAVRILHYAIAFVSERIDLFESSRVLNRITLFSF